LDAPPQIHRWPTSNLPSLPFTGNFDGHGLASGGRPADCHGRRTRLTRATTDPR
jgi:hypothetical protein